MKFSSVVLAVASLFVAASFPSATSSPVPASAPFGASSSIAASSSVMVTNPDNVLIGVPLRYAEPVMSLVCKHPPCGYVTFSIDLEAEYEYCLYHKQYDLTTCFRFSAPIKKVVINYILALIFEEDYFMQQNYYGPVQGFSQWSWFQGIIVVGKAGTNRFYYGYSASKGNQPTLGTTYYKV